MSLYISMFSSSLGFIAQRAFPQLNVQHARYPAVPLAHEATDMRTTDTAGSRRVWSGAVSPPKAVAYRRSAVYSTSGCVAYLCT